MVNLGILYSRIKYRFGGTSPTIQAALYTDITPPREHFLLPWSIFLYINQPFCKGF